MKRTTQKSHISANRFAARKPRNSLRNNRLKNRSRNIFPSGPFINKRLNISFCKNTAACRNRINLLSTFGKFIQPQSISFKQSRHLIDKSTSSPSTSTVHSLLNPAFKISNLGIFATQFNYNISFGNKLFYGRRSRNHFLNKRNI